MAVYHYLCLKVTGECDQNNQANDLVPAKNDLVHLKEFLKNDQKFDEVIVLENDDVHIENVNFFLSTYLINNALAHGKSRVLITYSGHGVGSSAVGSKGNLLLSQARSFQDTNQMLSMGILKTYFSELGPQNFQLLALVNACFGGDLFSDSRSGGNIYATNGPGARALTAPVRGFRREVQPRRQHWFLNRKSRFPFRTPPSARFPRDKDGSARRKIEPVQ